MRQKVKVTVVVENTASGEGMIPEHGMCFWIEIGSTKVIFDTGQGGALLNNARILKVSLEQTGFVVLSHGHYDHTGGPFFMDERCIKSDPLLDDQALFFESSRGIVVLLGCAHAGVINTLLYIQQLTHGKQIHAVMGGMHLLSASRKRMDNTIKYLVRINPDLLGPAHCTGKAATAELWEAFPQKCFSCPVGTSMEFD